MTHTNWYVITGAPSSGKTTLIGQLAAANYCIAPELAREYIESLLAKNYTLEDIRRDTTSMQRTILAIALKRERQLEKDKLIFFDRGTADSLGYFRYYHIDTSHAIEACRQIRYKKVFFCHQLPVVYDSVRVEDNHTAKKIGDLIYDSYIILGYELIELPAVSVQERMDLILNEINV